MTAAEIPIRDYQDALIGLLMQAGIIRDDGSIDTDAVCVSAYETAVAMLMRDGFITTETYRGFLGQKRMRQVFSYDAWRILRDRISLLAARFNTADPTAKLA